VARNLGLDDVVDHFTLVGNELDLLRNKSGATRLGFAVLLKFLLWHGRFPRALRELPDDAVAHLVCQVRVSAGELAALDLASRTAKRHRTEIRAYTGFRECSVTHARHNDGVADGARRRRRAPPRPRSRGVARALSRKLIEPPTPDGLTEIVRSALYHAPPPDHPSRSRRRLDRR
jgi:hypothetical protein